MKPFVNRFGKTRLIWFGGDVRLIRSALESYKQSLELGREYEAGEQLKSTDEKIVQCIDLLEHITWLESKEVQHLIQIDLGPDSYKPELK